MLQLGFDPALDVRDLLGIGREDFDACLLEGVLKKAWFIVKTVPSKPAFFTCLDCATAKVASMALISGIGERAFNCSNTTLGVLPVSAAYFAPAAARLWMASRT